MIVDVSDGVDIQTTLSESAERNLKGRNAACTLLLRMPFTKHEQAAGSDSEEGGRMEGKCKKRLSFPA